MFEKNKKLVELFMGPDTETYITICDFYCSPFFSIWFPSRSHHHVQIIEVKNGATIITRYNRPKTNASTSLFCFFFSLSFSHFGRIWIPPAISLHRILLLLIPQKLVLKPLVQSLRWSVRLLACLPLLLLSIKLKLPENFLTNQFCVL